MNNIQQFSYDLRYPQFIVSLSLSLSLSRWGRSSRQRRPPASCSTHQRAAHLTSSTPTAPLMLGSTVAAPPMPLLRPLPLPLPLKVTTTSLSRSLLFDVTGFLQEVDCQLMFLVFLTCTLLSHLDRLGKIFILQA